MVGLDDTPDNAIAPERLNRPLRGVVALLASLLTLAAIGWAANVYAWAGLALYNEQFLAAVLGLVLPLAYLTAPLIKGGSGRLPWYDALAALLGFATSFYVYFDYPRLANEIAYQPWEALLAAVILLLLIIEGVRRTAGPVLVVILLVFFVYAMWGHLLPGRLVGREIDTRELLIGLALDPQALLGAPLKIGTTVVISFLFLGQVLNLSGGSKFFTGLAMSVMGQYRGGSAKIAVIASSLFGAISGSAVSNVASTGLSCIELLLIVAVAGLVIGLLNTSGLGFALTYTLVEIGGGNLAVLLLLAAVICIVLGMGMPTLGVYVLVAALVAPSLIEIGIDPIAAHLFVLYFGMMSMITPPVAIAAFAAASMTRADPMKTGFEAVRFGWLAYMIPFLFILSPGLIMQGSIAEILYSTAVTVAGVWLFSVALIGYFVSPLNWTKRAAFLVSGLAAMSPTMVLLSPVFVNLAGILAGVLLAGAELGLRRKTAAT